MKLWIAFGFSPTSAAYQCAAAVGRKPCKPWIQCHPQPKNWSVETDRVQNLCREKLENLGWGPTSQSNDRALWKWSQFSGPTAQTWSLRIRNGERGENKQACHVASYRVAHPNTKSLYSSLSTDVTMANRLRCLRIAKLTYYVSYMPQLNFYQSYLM